MAIPAAQPRPHPDDPADALSPALRRLRERLAEPLPGRLTSARELARERLPAHLFFPTALSAVDRLLAGGLPRGRLVELVGGRSSGRFSIAIAALAATTAAGEVAALVDVANHLDPQLAALAGVDLERLLWARPGHLRKALVSAEMLLDGGFPLVVLDLGQPPIPGGRGVESSWLRLARAAAAREAALLVSSPYRVSGTAAAVVMKAARAHGRWLGSGRAPRLLSGLEPRMELEKLEGRPVTGAARLRLETAAAAINGRFDTRPSADAARASSAP